MSETMSWFLLGWASGVVLGSGITVALVTWWAKRQGGKEQR